MKNKDYDKDFMTALLDYAHTRDYISEYIEKDGTTGAALMVDIDDFQMLNDLLGYVFGDQIIHSVADILVNVFRSSDIIGRIGGDRFLVFLKGEISDDLIIKKADQVRSEVKDIYCGENRHRISVCIGVARVGAEPENFDDMYRKAEWALADAKRHGKNICHFYDETISKTSVKSTQNMAVSHPKDAYDVFYNEIAEMTFRLMEDTIDADSSILLLLRKIKEYFGFSVVSVQEIVKEKEQTLKYVYNLVPEGIYDLQDKEVEYGQDEWLHMKNTLECGRYIYRFEADDKRAEKIFCDSYAKSRVMGLRLPMGKKQFFHNIIDFIYVGETHDWEEREIRFLESFTRILSVYMNRIRTFDEAEYLAKMMKERDSVTGLYSYDTFLSRMKDFTKALREPCELVYTYSDFNNFKYINDTYGYDIGNLLLRKFGEYIMESNRGNVICASRVHSDNIVVVRRNSNGLTPEEYAARVDLWNEELTKTLKQYGHDEMINIRSGIFMTMSDAVSVEEAVTNAGYACKKNKGKRQNRCKIFTRKLMTEYKKGLRYISELKNAIDSGEMQVYIQPKTSAKNNRVVGGEALIRWIKTDGEVVLPGDFISVFEESGDIVILDYFVYREVCKYLRRRMDGNLPIVPISVNVSTLHLRDDNIMEYLDNLLEEYKIPARYIELELTENVYIDDLSRALKLVDWCKERGIRMAMDDFGSGYSSLNLLDDRRSGSSAGRQG